MKSPLIGQSPAIRLSDIRLRRGSTDILRGITWQVLRGSYAALVGPNGSGKTMLIRVIMGYEWPTEGRVQVLGECYGEVNLRELRKHIGLVNPSHLFGMDERLSAVEVVLTGLENTLTVYDPFTRRQIRHAEELLDTVGLAARRKHAFGLLSSGEQRRCLLARALVRLPELLILDEPTAGLDVAAREHLLHMVESLHHRPGGPTVVMVTHHIEELGPSCDHVLILHQGRKSAAGTPVEVFTDQRLSRVMGCQVKVHRRGKRHWLEVLPSTREDEWCQMSR